MKILSGALMALLLCAVPVPAPGAEAQAMRLEDHVAAVNRAARAPEGEPAVVQRLSHELELPAATLQAQREQTRLGWGEIRIANRIGQESGLSFEQVVREFRSGKGWGEIVREHNLSVGKLIGQRKEPRGDGRTAISPAGAGAGGREARSGVSSGANAPAGRGHPIFSGPSGHTWGAVGSHGAGRR